MSTVSRITINEPTNIPPISPPLAAALSPGIGCLSGLLVDGSGLPSWVVFVTGALPAVVIGWKVIGQSEDRSESREARQVGSTWRRDDWIMREALPLATQDWMREINPVALYTSVPTILPL